MARLFGPILGACLIAAMPGSATAQQAPASPSEQAAEVAEANAIIEIMFPPAEREKTFDAILANLSAQLRQGLSMDSVTDPGLRAIVNEFLDKSMATQKPIIQKHMPAIFASMAEAYSNEFSLAELKDIHVFARSPAGNHYLSRATAILGDPAVAKVNSQMIADAQKAALALREEMKARVAEYLAAHPDVTAEPGTDAKSN